MTTLSDPRSGSLPTQPPRAGVYDEPPVKPPPLLAVGPLAWARQNLFRTWIDTLLTFISVGVIVYAIRGLILWSIFEANWFIITFNLRLYLLGRYEQGADWRAQAITIIVAFVAGFTIAAWTRISRILAFIAVLLLAVTFIAPGIIVRTIPMPPAYVAAGAAKIVTGVSEETPQAQLGFIGKAGESFSIGLAEVRTTDDATLSHLSSFTDNAANLLRAAAVTRLETQTRIAEIEQILAEDENDGPTLTDGQRTRLQDELADLTVDPPVTETYALNQSPVSVRILRGTTLEPLVEGTLKPGDPPLTLTLPEDGWYVIDKTIPDSDTSAALLEVRGMYPLLQRSFTASGEVAEGETTSGNLALQTEYIRLTDRFVTGETRPEIDGDDVPMATSIDNQYRGERNLRDYLRLFLGPFLAQISVGLLAILGAVAVGYWLARGTDRLLPIPDKKTRRSRRIATWLLGATPFLMFGFIYGVGFGPLGFTDTRLWGGLMLTLMLTVVGIIASFPIGIGLALGRRSSLPIVSAICTIYIECVRGVPLITVLFMAQLLVPLVNPSLAEVPNVFRAMVGIVLFSAAYLAENVRGGLQAIPHGQVEAARAVGLSEPQIIMQIMLPQALRIVIPALVGQFISLFKDTSLVAIVGLLDLAGISQAVVTQTEFLGLRRESFIFITIIYFSVSYTMGLVSRRLEESGPGAALKRV